ncbi:MAG: thiamine pyrophosphate-binding protein [Thermomicrobiales bacterium]
MPLLTGAQALVQCLREEDVEFIFGVPGGQTLSVMDVLFTTPAIRFVTARHEGAAGHMADAYGRVTGKPGLCLVTTGPGATNLLTGIGGALRDSSPVIAITVNNRDVNIGWDDNQDADHVAIFRSLTKSSRFVPDAEGLPRAIRDAFRQALTGNPGPVHLDFARNALEEGAIALESRQPARYRPEHPPIGAPEAVAAAASALLAAERPLIWVGKGALLANAGEAVLALAQALSAPVITTYNGIGAVPATDRHVFGPRSRNGTALTRHLVAECDAILAIGNSLNAPTTSRWRLPLPERLIQVDLDPAVIGRNYPVDEAVIGDARAVTEQLLAAIAILPDANKEARAAWLAQAGEARGAWEARMAAAADSNAVPIKPQYLMREVAALIDDHTTVVADAGNPGIWSHLLPICRPRAYMKPVGFGNMGFGLPAAIAAKLARPHERVLLLVGDGSLGMSLAEIETAVREETPIAIVVLNDLSYGNIKQEQLHLFGPRYIGVDFRDVDYAGVARAMGADGERVEQPADLAPALRRAITAETPYLLDVLIDPRENVWEDPI